MRLTTRLFNWPDLYSYFRVQYRWSVTSVGSYLTSSVALARVALAVTDFEGIRDG
jgi:hypothetical protein